MTTAKIRWFSLLLVCLMLAGCNRPMVDMPLVDMPMVDMPMQNRQESEETKLFAQGLDQYIEYRDLTALKLLPQQYPQGEWRTRAEGIIDIAEQQMAQQKSLDEKNAELAKIQKQQELLDKKNAELAKIQKQHDQQQARLEKKDEELAHTLQEKEVLFQDNKILEVTLERLKQVLIDMELRTE